MELKHLVVDGSNIATEGRSLPSLKQLDEAVRTFLAENPTENVTVIVDATFGHRIDPSERAEFEEAILAGELVTPPAGAIGRGDRFVLQVADRVGAVILSNDSFQEFHGEYPWLFEEGRLVGGKPVPGVGWVFLLRTPVRGPASRRSVRVARAAADSAPAVGDLARARRRRRARSTAADEVAEPAAATVSAAAPINEPLPFIEFVANHPVGSQVKGEVERFASHGAYIVADGARCYVGLKFMGDPPPRSAKEVLRVGEVRTFAVHAFDTPRRGIDLALVERGPIGTVHAPVLVTATTKERTVAKRRAKAAKASRDSRVAVVGKEEDVASLAASSRDATKAPTTTSSTATTSAVDNAQEAPVTPVKRAVARKAPAKKKAVAKRAVKKATAKKATAKRTAVKKKAVAKRVVKKKATAKKATAKRTVKKAAAKKKAVAKRAPAKKKAAAKRAVKKAATRRAPLKRVAVRKAVSRATATRTTASSTRAPRATAAAKPAASRTTTRTSRSSS